MDLVCRAENEVARAGIRPMREVERGLAASLKPAVACCIAKTERYEYPPGGMRVIESYEVLRLPDDRGALMQAIDAFRAANAPAPYDLAVQEVMRLRYATAARNAGQDDLELILGLMADEVSRYPADVVVEVLRERARSSRWWPPLKDVLDDLNAAVSRRRSLLECLERMVDRIEATPERDKIRSLAGALAGSLRADRHAGR